MRRFHFEMEEVLRHKDRLERQAEARVAQAAAELQQIREEMERCRQELDKLAQVMSDMGTRHADRWCERFEQSGRWAEAVRRAEQRVVEAQTRLEEAIRARVAIGIEVEALRLLKTQRLQEHRRELERVRQKESDDAAIRRRLANG